ncbi:hypothetical protein [Oribacterium sinus]
MSYFLQYNARERVYFSFKETNPELQYRHGPIKINGEDSYWILTTVNNMCPDGNMIAEDVRLSMKIRRISETEVTLKIICQVAKPQVSEHTIKFVSERPFELVYFNGSPYLYSEYYGLRGDRGMLLTDNIMTEQGTLLGFWEIDGKIPGGANNAVTVSIKVKVKR